MLEGEVIGVGSLLIHEDDEDKVACVRVVYENGFQQDLYNYEGDDEFGAARDAFERWEAFKVRGRVFRGSGGRQLDAGR